MKKEELKELLQVIDNFNQNDWVDILGVFAPLLFSVVTILFTVYTTMVLPKKISFTATLFWDDLMDRFIVLIINQGNASIVIDKVRLFIYGAEGEQNLGERRCFCDTKGKVIVIEPGKAFSFTPRKGSINDLFGYKGHYFELTEDIRFKKVYIEAKDIKGNMYKEETKFFLGEIDEYMEYQNEKNLHKKQ